MCHPRELPLVRPGRARRLPDLPGGHQSVRGTGLGRPITGRNTTMSGSKFTVDLGGLQLTPILEERLDAQIRSSVLSALAQMEVPDLHGAIDFKELDPEIRGIYAVINEGLLQDLNSRGFGR